MQKPGGRVFKSRTALLFMETLQEFIVNLKKCNKLIIVEGKKDKKTLKDLGITKTIAFSSFPIHNIEKIHEKEVIILTDLDYFGKKLHAILKKELQKRKIKVDEKFRTFLFKKTKISTIESLKHYVE